MKTNESKKSPLNLRIQRLRGSVKTSLLTGVNTATCQPSDDCPETDYTCPLDPGNTRGLGCVGGSGASAGSDDTRC